MENENKTGTEVINAKNSFKFNKTNIILQGDINGTGQIDGSSDVTIETQLQINTTNLPFSFFLSSM